MNEKSVIDKNIDPVPDYNKPKIKFSLRLVFLVPFMVQIIIIAGLIGFISFRTGQNAIYEVAGRLHGEINTRIIEYLKNFIETPAQIINNNSIALSHGVLNYSDQKSLEHYFLEQLQIYKSVSSISFGNSTGGVVNSSRDTVSGAPFIIGTEGFTHGNLRKFSTDTEGNRDRVVLSVPDFDSRNRPWYMAAVKKGDIVWSDVYIFITAQDLAISASRPVYMTGGRFLGVVSVDLFLSHISNFLASMNIGKTGLCFIMEPDGQLIATSSNEVIFTPGKDGENYKRLAAGGSNKLLIRATADKLLEKFGSYDRIDSDHQTSFPIKGKIVHAHVAPFNNINGLNWIIVTVIPDMDFMEKIIANTRITVLLIAIAVIISVITGFFTTRWITAPVLKLQSSVQALAEGKWPEIFIESRIIEISDLKKSFFKMSRQLKELIDNLTLEISERKQAEEALGKSEEKYRELVEYSNSIIIRRDITGKLTFINEYAQKFFGYTSEEIIGKNIVGTIVPFFDKDGKDLRQMILDIGAHPEFYEKNENENMRKDGSAVWIVWSNKGIADENGRCVEILGIGADITKRRLAEIEIKKLLAEKELILHEVHHRIKNNMSTIAGLLYLQAETMKDETAAAALHDARSRVLSMMLIYDKLYNSRDFNSISTANYLSELINEVSSTFPSYDSVKIEKQLDDCTMDSKVLVPVGIIINELLTNAFKYAFPGMRKGEIGISFIRIDDISFKIIFRDNGAGIPETVIPGKSEDFGLNLVNLLVRQMDGTVEIIRGEGSTFVIRFKIDNI